MMRIAPALIALLLLGTGPMARAEVHPSWEPVRPGVDYAFLRARDKGPVRVHVIRADLSRPGVGLRTLHGGRKRSPARLSEAARLAGVPVLAAINGDFFSFQGMAGMPWGLQVTEGRIVRAPTGKTALFVEGGRAVLRRLDFRGAVRAAGETALLGRVNQPCQGSELTLYNGVFGKRVPGAWASNARAVVGLHGALRLGAVTSGRIAAIQRAEVPEGGAILIACGQAKRFLTERLAPGAEVTLDLRLEGVTAPVTEAIGGIPRVLRDGQVALEYGAERIPRGIVGYISGRHPRSGVGIGDGGRTIYLVYAEGRTTGSAGIRAEPFARLLQDLGARDGMLFDGGGSATLWVDGKTKGPNGHRSVANALAITFNDKAK